MAGATCALSLDDHMVKQEFVNGLIAVLSEFTQLDGSAKRAGKCFCVTSVTQSPVHIAVLWLTTRGRQSSAGNFVKHKVPHTRCNFSCNVARSKIGGVSYTMQFVARNVAKEELDSTSATVARHVARKIASCVRGLNCHATVTLSRWSYKIFTVTLVIQDLVVLFHLLPCHQDLVVLFHLLPCCARSLFSPHTNS